MDTTAITDLRTLAFTTPLAVLAAAGHHFSLPLEAACPSCGCGLIAHDALVSAPSLLTAGRLIPGHITCDPCRTICGTAQLDDRHFR